MSDYLKQVEDQLVELTERGAHRRPRPRRDVVAIAAGVAAVAAVALAISTIGGNAPRHASASHHPKVQATPHHRGGRQQAPVTTTPPVVTHPPAGGPVPPGFGPQSFTAISELNWWLLGTARCSSPPCVSIVRTTDGGQSFVGIPAPRATGFGNVSQLRFANAQDGFAFGPELWTTHDGGAH